MGKNFEVSYEQAGFAPADWCQATSISRAKLYQLPVDLQTHSVKLGRRRIITESPSGYLERIKNTKNESV
jgi:hypothetical protein